MLLGGVAEADLSDLKIEEAQQAPFVPKVRDHEDHEDHSPAAYRPHAGGRDVRDITATFLEASSKLEAGHLVKDEYFTLFESVGALEIMDRKMDSGVSVPDQDSTMEEFDPLHHTLPEEIVAIMDDMLSQKMTWHEGYPLSQTLFASLHLNSLLYADTVPLDRLIFRSRLNPRTVERSDLVLEVLRAYCLGIVKCCDFVVREVISEHYYEEEDFLTQTFTIDLLTGCEASQINAVLDQALSALESLRLPDVLAGAIKARLTLIQCLLRAFDPSIDSKKSQLWLEVVAALKVVDQSHTLGSPVPGAFSERVQRYLASTTPPRPRITTSWSDAVTKLERLCKDNSEAYQLEQLLPSPSPNALMHFVWSYNSRTPQPSTYSRSVLQGLLFKSSSIMSTVPHMDLLVTDLRDTVLAGDLIFSASNWEIELPSDPRYQLARKIDEFLTKAMDEYLNIYRMICQNRCRIRRTMAQSVALLDNLQAVTEDIDLQIHNICQQAAPGQIRRQEPASFYPLSGWIYLQKLRIMEWTALLGFELDVYLADEYAAMYLFLSHLTTSRYEHLTHIKLVLRARLQRLQRAGSVPEADEVQQSLDYLHVLSANALSASALSYTLGKIYALFNTIGVIATPQRSYSSDDLRYEVRMKPFLPVGTPELPTQTEIYDATHWPSETRVSSILDSIDEQVKQAKAALGIMKAANAQEGRFLGVEGVWKKNCQSLLLSTISAGVCAAGLRVAFRKASVEKIGDLGSKEQGGKGISRAEALRESVKVESMGLEKRYHAWWVVPRLIQK